MEIKPTILEKDKKNFLKFVDKYKYYFSSIHIDFMDGTFTKQKTLSFDEILEIVKDYNINFEIHLMTKFPQKYFKELLICKKILKVIFHVEPFESENELLEIIKKIKLHKNVYLAFNPETELITNKKIINLVDGFMLMGVNPGRSGQKFEDNVLFKVEFIKKQFPELNLEIDGGVNLNNFCKLKKAGFNIFALGSYFKDSDNIKESLDKLNCYQRVNTNF